MEYDKNSRLYGKKDDVNYHVEGFENDIQELRESKVYRNKF